MEALTRIGGAPATVSAAAAEFPHRAVVLGLDPGSLITGYAVIECVGDRTQYLLCGSIRARGAELPSRLADIFRGVSDLASEWKPQEVAIERVFMHRNADSALKLGQARGAALCGALSGAPTVFEYSPREVKQAVVGTGAAQKDQVQLMVKQLLKIPATLDPDAADALAIALCHAHSRRMHALLAAPRRTRG
jgi:crossover junction endodeoxyribonuclease RuvC